MRECAAAAYAHYITRIGKPPGPMLEDYSQVVAAHEAFVAETHGAVVAFVVLVRTPETVLLDNVAVLPACQGRGLGKRLIALAEARAREHGFRAIDLYTHERMLENAAMYERLGYRETGRKTVNGYRRIYLRKQLC